MLGRAPATPAELLRAHGLSAKKSWGQNFLHDRGVIARIADAARLASDDVVVEIGAGLGALTRALAERAGRVVAIERDRDLVAVLRRELADVERVEIVEANALTYPLRDVVAGDAKVHVVGNLPYHISSPLLFALLDQRDVIARATLMLQRELAERIVSPPGSRVYGAPSVVVQQQADVALVLSVGRGAFTPPPKVDSSVIQLVPKATDVPDGFVALVRAAFAQRRKQLPRALAAAYGRERVSAALEALSLPVTARAEVLSPTQFVALAAALGAPAAP